MTVYVDDMRAKFGRMIMCHMIADTDDELHAMAGRLGIKRRWHQAPPRHDSHYDIALSKRELAVKFGAREINQRQLACMSTYRKFTGKALPPPEQAEAMFALLMKEKREARQGENAGTDHR